jgi:hypothetical protein
MAGGVWSDVWIGGTRSRFSLELWRSTIGLSITAVMVIWEALPAAVLAEHKLEPVHLLYLLSWFRLYETWLTAAARWHVTPKTYRKWVKLMLIVLHRHLHFIQLGNRAEYPAAFANLAWLVVDSTFCPLEVNRKNWDVQAAYFSVKHGAHGLKYEVAVNWLTGKLHWVAGGVFGSVSDITITRHSGLLRLLVDGEFLLADKGYEGEVQILTPFKGRSFELLPDQLIWNRLMNPVRTIVENAFARFHKFKILSTRFRGASQPPSHLRCHCTARTGRHRGSAPPP